VYPDSGHVADGAAATRARGRYLVKDLGSVLIGDGGRGILKDDGDDADWDSDMERVGQDSRWNVRIAPGDASKTLADAKFVVGDYISCAILPPLTSGISVTAAAARAGRGPGFIETRSSIGGVLPPPYRRDGPGPRGAMMRGPRTDQYGRTIRDRDGVGAFESSYGHGVPNGEWRRGEQLPDTAGGRSRGDGRW
jgi:histone deacetylase complex subunit SAP18